MLSEMPFTRVAHAPHPWSISGAALAFLFCIQIFNNAAFSIVGPFTVGEIGSVLACIVIAFSTRVRSITIHPQSGLAFLFCLALYWFSAATALSVAGFPTESGRFLATVSVQVLLSVIVYLAIRPAHLRIIVTSFGLFAAALGFLNFLNAVLPNFDFLIIRENFGRGWLRDFLAEQRVVSITNIYAQLGVLFVFGGFALMGYWTELADCWRKGHLRILALIIVITVTVGILALQSRATIVGFLVGLFIYFWCLAGRQWRLAILYLGILGLLVFFHDIFDFFAAILTDFSRLQQSTVVSRLEGYREALHIIASNPLGIGHGQFTIQTGSEMVLHNTILDGFISTGWFGGFAFLVLIALPVLILFRPALRHHRFDAGWLGGYIGALVISLFYTGLTEYFLFITIASVLGITRYRLLEKSQLREGI